MRLALFLYASQELTNKQKYLVLRTSELKMKDEN